MYKNKLNKIWNLIDKIKNDINLPIISDFLEWFHELLNLNFNKNEPNLQLNKWDIYFVNLWKNIWSELNKIRPCIIYSNYFFNNWKTTVVIPLKSYKWKINKKVHILIYWNKINNLKLDSIVDLLSIRQVSKKRILLKRWFLSKKELEKIDKQILKIFEIKN